MPVIVQLPSGQEVEFPDGTTPDQFGAVLRRDFADQFQPADPRATRKAALRAEMDKARAEKVSDQFTPLERFAARAGAGLEQGLELPSRMLRAGADLIGVGGENNRQWLQYYADKDRQTAADLALMDDNSTAGQLVQGVFRAGAELPPQLMGGFAARTTEGAVNASAAAAGLIGAGSQYLQDRGEGRGKLESAGQAALSGAITAVTTRAFGATGVEGVFKDEGVKGIGARLLGVLKAAGAEGAEEWVDQVQQDLLQRATRQPEKPIRESLNESLMAFGIGSILGGGVNALRQRNGTPPPATPEPGTPNPEQPEVIINEATGTSEFPPIENDIFAEPAPEPATPSRAPASPVATFTGPNGENIEVETGGASLDAVKEMVFRAHPGAEFVSATEGAAAEKPGAGELDYPGGELPPAWYPPEVEQTAKAPMPPSEIETQPAKPLIADTQIKPSARSSGKPWEMSRQEYIESETRRWGTTPEEEGAAYDEMMARRISPPAQVAPTEAQPRPTVDAVGLSREQENYLSRMATRASSVASQTEGGRGVAVGSGQVEYRWREAALYDIRDALRAGKSLAEAEEIAKQKSKQYVQAHNAKRPKDYMAWQRWDESTYRFIENTVSDLREIQRGQMDETGALIKPSPPAQVAPTEAQPRPTAEPAPEAETRKLPPRPPNSIAFGRAGELLTRPDADLIAIKPTRDGNDYFVKRYNSRKALETFLKTGGGWKAIVKTQVGKNMLIHPAFEVERDSSSPASTSSPPATPGAAGGLEAPGKARPTATPSAAGGLEATGKARGKAKPAESPAQAIAKVVEHVEETKADAPTPKAAMRDAKEIKSELITRLEQAVKDAPEGDVEWLQQRANLRRQYREDSLYWKKEFDKKTKAQLLREFDENAPALDAFEKQPKITIEIPGDGTFTIFNTKKALGEVLERAKKLKTSTTYKGYTESIPPAGIPADVWVESSEPTHRITFKSDRGVQEQRLAKPVELPELPGVKLFITSDGQSFSITEPRTGLRIGPEGKLEKATIAGARKRLQETKTTPEKYEDVVQKAIEAGSVGKVEEMAKPTPAPAPVSGALDAAEQAQMSLAAGVKSPASPTSAVADVQAIVVEEASDAPVTVVHDATLTHNGQTVEGYLDPQTGRIVINAAAPTMRDPANVRRVVREERAHWLLATSEGQAELRKFTGQMTPAQRAELQRQGYRRMAGESAEAYEARLHNEFIAKQARENTVWWRKLVERVREWLAKNGLAKLTSEEAARAILRRLNAAQAERQLAHGYLELGNGMVLVAPWAKVSDVQASLTAYHGTPHKLRKFSTKFIGTGEGAQVYGWGLYFAENQEVAGSYSRMGNRIEINGQDTRKWALPDAARDYLKQIFDGKSQAVRTRARNKLREMAMSTLRVADTRQAELDAKKNAGQLREDIWEHNSGVNARAREVANEILSALNSDNIRNITGNEYTVSLNVEPEDLLDWDKPLSEQSEKVKAALQDEVSKRRLPDSTRGEMIYEWMVSGEEAKGNAAPENGASERLSSLGIKGIRYLDQGSRTIQPSSDSLAQLQRAQSYLEKARQSGVETVIKQAEAQVRMAEFEVEKSKQQPTYNYVIFDENDITITHENGQPVSAGELIPNFSLAPATPVAPDTQTQISVIEQQAGNVNQHPAAPTLGTSPELRNKWRDSWGTVSGKLAYYGGQALLKAKRGLDLTAAYQAAAVKTQSDNLLNQLFSSAYTAQAGFKLPQWMKVGAWANRTRAFKKRLLHVAARLNATGRNPDGSFKFDDFKMRAGMMTPSAFKAGEHAVGDTFLHVDPQTGVQETLEVGPMVQTPDGRMGYQIFRSMAGGTQSELYRTMSESYPELVWLLDMFIDPSLAGVRQKVNGIEVPVFNRFAQAAMMAEADPNFTPLTGYTPDVLVSRSLIGAIRGALSFNQGTRSPGRKYKFGTSRESGHVRDLLTGFNVRTFQMLQEKARKEWRNEVFKAAQAIPKTGLPAGWVKLETGMEELWQAVKRLRNWTSPESWKSAQKEIENSTPEEIESNLKPNQRLEEKGGKWFVVTKLFPETEARLSEKGFINDEDLGVDYQKFFWEVKSLRGKQLMLPQPLIDSLLKRYVIQKQHGALYRLGAWAVRNSTQLFLVAPKTYVANVLTNDLFALEAGTRYALQGLASRDAASLRFAKELFASIFTNRFAAFRQGTGMFAGSDYMTAIREILPEEIFADSTSLADVKVRWGHSAVEYLAEGEIGAAALQLIQYGSIDTRAKQRMAFAFLKAQAVTNARRAGLTGAAMEAAVNRYLANPPQADRVRAVEVANFELLNYADSPQALNDLAQNDYSRLLLPFPRFGYHYVTKQLKRASAAKVFLGKVPKGQRADAFADLVTFALFPAGGAGILALLASGLDDDDDARALIGTSSVVKVNPDGSVSRKPIDREFITANRLNISAWARAMGIESDNEDDFWLRVRNYPVVAAAGVTALAYADAREHGVKYGARQFARGAGDLASDFFSVGAGLKVPFKIAADLQSDTPQRTLVDPFSQGVPLSFYLTEQLTDSFIPGSRQADELLVWVNPVRPRRTASKTLGYDPGVVEAIEASHLSGLLMQVVKGETRLPPAGTIDRRTATVPRPSTVSLSERASSLAGFNVKAIPRGEYERAISK